MKKNLPVSQVENDYDENIRIVSTTDLKGKITYANEDFMTVAGFTEEELLGKSHNIVRHPDVPPAAFKDCWDTLKQGKPWMGVVKNRCKNGDHYWVDAFISPVFEQGQVSGYQSVRLKPSKALIKQAEKVYQSINNPAPKILQLFHSHKPGLMGAIIAAGTVMILAGVLVSWISGLQPQWSWMLPIASMMVINIAMAKWIARPWQTAAEDSRKLFDNGVARALYAGRQNELGQLETVIHYYKLKLETVVWRIGDATEQLANNSGSSVEVTRSTEQSMHRQKQEVEQVATAMNEMTTTVQEVARNTCCTADSTREADDEVNNGKLIVSGTVEQIMRLADVMEQAMKVINELAEHSGQIGIIVEVINNIAEQTNLLALNAAIEAARAGEQGRGFAVVADEVRTLAGRTQTSTHEIQDMIQKLQTSAETVVKVMQSGQETVGDCVEQGKQAGQSLESITNAVDRITQMTTQIATAAEQQSVVSEEINRNITRINDLSDETLNSSRVSLHSNEQIGEEVCKLNEMVHQFGIRN